MFRKALAWASLATCLAIPGIAWGTSGNTVVTVNADVDEIVEWDSLTQTIGIGTHITAIGQSQSAEITMAVYSNSVSGVTITSAGTANGGVLTETNPGGTDTLITSYSVNGTGVKLADRDGAGVFVASGAFLATKSYEVQYAQDQGTYQVKLAAKATAPSTKAPAAGSYTCSLTLTATSI